MDASNDIMLEDARRYIYALDFSKIIEKMVKYQGWLKKDALFVAEIYRNFLFLKKKYGKEYEIPPTEEIDEFWHNHILDTRQYQIDCQVIFGSYLHHYPYFGIDGKSNLQDLQIAFDRMQELYFKEFGSQLYKLKGFKFKMISVIKRGLLLANYHQRKLDRM